MNKTIILMLAVGAVGLSGCASNDPSALYLGTAGTVGFVASDGDPLVTGASAAAGYAAGALVARRRETTRQKELAHAFAEGEAKAVRDLFEAIQRGQQAATTAPEPIDHTVYVPVSVPRRIVNGVVVEATTEYLALHDQ